jgi:hypothetical protein
MEEGEQALLGSAEEGGDHVAGLAQRVSGVNRCRVAPVRVAGFEAGHEPEAVVAVE